MNLMSGDSKFDVGETGIIDSKVRPHSEVLGVLVAIAVGRLGGKEAGGGMRSIWRRKAPVDSSVAAQSVRSQQGSTSFNRPAATN
jgi:hypothetical protein